MRGFALAAHIGLSSLLLLVAAILLTQLFARRSLAFAGVLAAMVLYVAVLDRAALATHLSRLADPQAPLATRLVACQQATDTFFYRQTTLGRLRGLAKDATAPERLRQMAGRMADGLLGVGSM